LRTVELDVTDQAALGRAATDCDLVVGAVPGSLGYQMLKTVIEAGRDIVDISFAPENVLDLHDLAVERNVTAIVDMGLQPGLGNLVLGRYNQEYDAIDRFTCYVGGLPQVRRWPFEYQSVFSPSDVIEEYTRPARLRVNGRTVSLPALSDVELIDLPRVGTLEAFNTDGLRSLLQTMPVPNMVEKTLRYPGHAERMRMLREMGLFSREPLEINGIRIAPLDITSRLLFDMWAPQGKGRDLAIMRVEIRGQIKGRELLTTMDLYDEYDDESGTTAMARTTGYTCAAAARLLLNGTYQEAGVRPPEHLGADRKAYDLLVKDLAQRGVELVINQEEVD
ncbi:MAG: saccharopine dehydrogenase NADP-binding domain-containing protein, partial [Candidatus Marinimicrobia bacterium]|nr:saccharopine dehydrogenase NADP-binding domain-containing protein [Candidatus Neomarinimicrobiota bacterium]